ncbi:F-actin-uncapping protein LRRC16A-like isoform X2 [Oppia nitens]|uniref:F-actin-uncapping protein LRRC16A-like isoform X2 n=1 Tax=Oppia nitens TaxID=1686743 RepID=UPI0023DCAD24|nr:F-actin-uncapping protein LRRC16A-like isoform X2 [Oppia nitens]
MSTKGSLTKELSESVSTLLGQSVKISLKCLVKMEIKNDKTENKILAFSACRLFILTAKVTTKIEHSFHYLDINSIESKRKNQLTIGVTSENKCYTFYSIDANNGEEINLMVIQLGTALKTIFPYISLDSFIRRLEVEPISRLQSMIEYNQSVEQRATLNTIESPCGGFSTQYACLCDYFNAVYREEVVWDVDTIYSTHNNQEFSLLDFEHLDHKDFIPIIAALSYNGWFTRFRASNIKVFGHVMPDVSEQIFNLVKRSTVLEEIYLDNTGLKADSVNKLFMAILTNSQTVIHYIDLSNNVIEDKGLKYLNGFVAKSFLNNGVSDESIVSSISLRLNKGLTHLNLSHTSITSKGVSDLSDSLFLNKSISQSLTHLNISDNLLKDDVNKLYNFLANPNCITHLDLSGTECLLETIFAALLRGCTQKLVHLNLARNQFNNKKSHKDVNPPPSFKTFFSSTIALKTLNLSSNRLPAEALKAMLLGFACNEIASDVRINLSSNEFKSSGATVLEFALGGIRCISGLDLSDNSFDVDVMNVINSVGKNKSIKYLSIGKNFANIKPKHIPRVLESLVHLLQDEDSVLESLSLVDSKLRNDTCLVINALGSNQSLVNIDVTGNMMGLPGARTLAKALQVNSKLETIYLDRNLIPTAGFVDIAYSLERNYTLKYMPVPVQDVQQAMVKMAERTEAAITKIQELLRRNHLPQTILKNSRLHNHHMQIDSNVYHSVDKLTINLTDILNNSSINENNKSVFELNAKDEEVLRAESYLKDAANAKHLLTHLNQKLIFPEITESGRRLSTLSICRPIEAKLIETSVELKKTFEAHINSVIASMIETIQEQCPHVIADSERLQSELNRIFNNTKNSPLLPSLNFFQSCLSDSVGALLTTKIEEILLGIAAQICDKVLVEVNDCLVMSQRALTGQEPIKSLSQRSSTPDVLRSRTWIEDSRESSSEAILSSDGHNEEPTDATPKQSNQKRQSLYVRRLRPQSVMDGISPDEIPDLLPKADSSKSGLISIDSSILKSTSSDRLEHLAKTRPKKPKTRAPTRVTTNTQLVKTETINPNAQQSGDRVEKLDEGLDSFFTKTTTSELINKPQVQPRVGLFKKLYTKPLDTSKPNSSDKSGLNNESNVSIGCAPTSLLSARIDEVTRSRSSPNLVKKTSHSIPISRNNSPGAEEITNILDSNERTTSPLPTERSDLLAEMKAKQGRRSLAPTPTTPPLSIVDSNPLINNSNNGLQGVKLRATVFGDILKSPNKIPNTAIEDTPSMSISLTDTNRSSIRQSLPPPLKQRPKSVVGMIGAKFELSLNSKDENIDSDIDGKHNSESIKGDRSGAKKSSILSKSRSNSSSSNSSLQK